jgi:hypothetical protein
VGATYEVAARLQSSGKATAEQADMLRSAADAAFLPAFHVAAFIALGLLLLALVIILLWLPARAEAVISAIQAEVDRYWNEAEHD